MIAVSLGCMLKQPSENTNSKYRIEQLLVAPSPHVTKLVHIKCGGKKPASVSIVRPARTTDLRNGLVPGR